MQHLKRNTSQAKELVVKSKASILDVAAKKLIFPSHFLIFWLEVLNIGQKPVHDGDLWPQPLGIRVGV